MRVLRSDRVVVVVVVFISAAAGFVAGRESSPAVAEASRVRATLDMVSGETSALKDQLSRRQASIRALKARVDSLATDLRTSRRTAFFLTSKRCDVRSCLFTQGTPGEPVGFGRLTGYFMPIERTAWGETKVCDGFVVTGGSRSLTRFLTALVEQGNGVHSLDRQGRPIINLDLSRSAPAIRREIRASSRERQARLLTLLGTRPGTEAPVCTTFVSLVAAEAA